MRQAEPTYEVFFTLKSDVSEELRGTFRWSWVRIRSDGFVTVRGQIYPDLRAAIEAAAAYRRDNGGGQIRVNIQEVQHRDARDAIYLS